MNPSDLKALSNISPRGQVTVPAEMRRALGLEPGGKVRFVLNSKIEFADALILVDARRREIPLHTFDRKLGQQDGAVLIAA